MDITKCGLDNKDLVLRLEYKLSELDLKIFKFLKSEGYLEIRDNERNNFNEDILSSELMVSINTLYNYNFIDNDYDAWHETYILTELGNSIRFE